MISIAERELITKIVEGKNAQQMVSEIMASYALMSAENASYIMEEATSLVKFLMCQNANDLRSHKKAISAFLEEGPFTHRTELEHLLPICMVLFPDAHDNPERGEVANNYLERLIWLSCNTSAYNPNDKNDRRWANERGYRKYLDTCRKIGERGLLP